MSYRKSHIHPKIKKLRKRKNMLKSRVFWVCLAATFLGASTVYIFFFFPPFKVTSIVASGNSTIGSEELENATYSHLEGVFGIPSKSILAVSTKEVQKELIKSFPVIKKVSIVKRFPDTVTLTIEERKPVATVCFRGQSADCFLIDDNGVIFEKTFHIFNNLVLHKDSPMDQVFLGDQVIPKNTMDFIIKVQTALRDNFQVDIQEVAITNPMAIRTSEHWDLYFNLEGDTNAQITRINTLLEIEIPEEKRKNLEYIYLQYGDKAYYK